MNLTPQQTNELLEIIDKNQAIFTAQSYGVEYLSNYDRWILEKNGISLEDLYQITKDTVFTSFHFGLLADSLASLDQVKNINFKDVQQYIRQGKYIPLTNYEKDVISRIKQQSLTSLRSIKGRIFQDAYGIITSRKDQENFIIDQIEGGIENKKTTRQVANDIARKVGDWSRDFDRIVQYTSQTAYEQGKAAAIARKNGSEAKVYKTVYPGACKHCIKHYLTNGIGSEPIIYKLSELIANGNNIGKKVDEWLPTIDALHPFCRCTLHHLDDGYEWGKEEKRYKRIDNYKPTLKTPRKPIKATIGGVEVFI